MAFHRKRRAKPVSGLIGPISGGENQEDEKEPKGNFIYMEALSTLIVGKGFKLGLPFLKMPVEFLRIMPHEAGEKQPCQFSQTNYQQHIIPLAKATYP
jgi:hypothetical protein